MLGRIFDLMGGLLGQGAPEALNAAGFSDSPHFMYSGFNGKGEWYQLFQIGFGGIPGRPAGDGPDGHSLWPAFTNVPNEFLEAYFPLRILEYSTIAELGGAGVHRGGNGVTIAYEMLEPGEISIHDDRWLTYPWGVNGGEPGMRSTKRLVRKNGSAENIPSKCDRIHVEPGDVLHFNTWGGGGWGDPLKREPEKVAADVARRLVTVKGAARYGVVVSPEGRLDAVATERLRRDMAAKRGSTALFDRGFKSIAELRARCKAETGFDPPSEPRFRTTYKIAAEIAGQDDVDRRCRGTGRELRPRRLSRRSSLGRRPALILIDFAQAYFEPTLAAVRRRRLQDRARFSAASCGQSRMNAAFRSFSPKSSIERAGPTAAFSSGRRRCCRVFWRAARPSAMPTGCRPVKTKSSSPSNIRAPSSARASAATLTSAGVDSLVITGLTTSGCVRATCVDSMSSGFITIVAREGVGDRDPRPHEANLYDMNAKYADVAPETRVTEYFHSCAHWRSSDGR